MRYSNIICLNFTSDTLKIAHLKAQAGRREIANLISRDIRGLADSEISKGIKSVLSDLAIRNPSAINVIPSPMAITRNIEVPSQNTNEIQEIVNLQASRLTPYAREDIIIDYINIGTYRKNYTKLLLITVTRSLIKRQIDILLGSGIKTEQVCFSVEPIARVISQFANMESDDSAANILHIDSNFTDFIVALKGKIIFVRGIPIGIEQIMAGKEQYQPRFLEEIKKSLEAYKVEDIYKSPQRLVLTGAVENSKDLESALNSALHIPVSVVSYFKHIHIPQEVKGAVALFERQSFLDVVAPLIAVDRPRLNLILEEIKLKKLLEEKGKEIVKAGALVMAGFILICAILVSRIYFKGFYLKELSSRYNRQHGEAQKLEEDFTRVQAVKNYLALRGCSLSVLGALYDVIPRDAQLAEIRFEREGKFNIKGSAVSMGAVFALIDDMGKTGYFKDVKSKYTTKRKEMDRDVVDFEIASLVRHKN